ncbi:MAG: PorT family protein [Bacteroidia bacterium]|jgi:hypothetical protein|nr:PorT family protein [Bacteroidia bacterium]
MGSLRIVILLSLLLLFTQQNHAQKFVGGAMAGINTSQITGDDLAGYDKLSPAAGLLLRLPFGEKWSVQMEIAYLGKGSRKNISPRDSVPTFYLLRLHYIEVPFMVQYKIRPKIELETGPSVGVLFKWYEEDTFGELGGPYSSREHFKPLDISWGFGGTWWFKEKWGLNVRSLSTMFPVRNHDQKSSYRLNRGQYSSSIMARLSYLF